MKNTIVGAAQKKRFPGNLMNNQRILSPAPCASTSTRLQLGKKGFYDPLLQEFLPFLRAKAA
jgi:hypothetical protein